MTKKPHLSIRPKGLSSASISAGWLMDALQQKGIKLSEKPPELELSAADSASAHGFLSWEDYNGLFEWGAEKLEDECLGIHIAENLDLTRWGIFGYLLLHSATLADLCTFAERYLSIFQKGASLTYRSQDNVCECRYEVLAVNTTAVRQDVEFSLALPILFFRRQLGPSWIPSEVFFEHSPPQDPGCHQAIFGDNLHFNCGINGFNFDANILTEKVSDSDPQLLQVLQSQANHLLSQIEQQPDPIKHIKLLITASLGGNYLGAEDIASQLNMTSRTLHRHLGSNDTSFQALRNEVVMHAAKEALTTTDANITEIALKLGYSEVSAFVRAFKRLEGLPPLQYRKQQR